MYYNERMLQEREHHDESQRQIAKALNISQNQYWKYETGITTLPIKYLVAFCNHYKVSADYILGLPKNYRWPRERS